MTSTNDKKRKKEEKKKDKKKHKKHKKDKKDKTDDKETKSNDKDDSPLTIATVEDGSHPVAKTPRTVISSAGCKDKDAVTLLLFYHYIEPPWTQKEFNAAKQFCEKSGNTHSITGRMRVAYEGLNCTLTGKQSSIRQWISELCEFSETFYDTEFKLTDDLPPGQRFPKLHVFKVDEIVNYGLSGSKAPPIVKTGVHLEPSEYHAKMNEKDTVIIDVRNYYESAIGHFSPPEGGAQLIDPKMRKSTEFPVWLDKESTKESLKGKQVLMYCTGGVRCERASALLRDKIDKEDDMKALGIKGVYQLQGGIDKYFREFPEGGNWAGKNYVFDKRFSHVPDKVQKEDILGNCEACNKPWDKYRGKRRCPTCGVPSLICKDCFDKDAKGIQKLGKEIRCKLCVEQNITSKTQIKNREQLYLKQYQDKMKLSQQSHHSEINKHSLNQNTLKTHTPNPQNITRLFIKNMHKTNMDEATLCQTLPGITHIQWLTDRKTGHFYGSAFVELATPDHAAQAVAKDGVKVFGRPIKIKFQKPDEKDVWPPFNTAVTSHVES